MIIGDLKTSEKSLLLKIMLLGALNCMYSPYMTKKTCYLTQETLFFTEGSLQDIIVFLK